MIRTEIVNISCNVPNIKNYTLFSDSNRSAGHVIFVADRILDFKDAEPYFIAGIIGGIVVTFRLIIIEDKLVFRDKVRQKHGKFAGFVIIVI